MGQCSRQAYFKFYLYKVLILQVFLVIPQLNIVLMYCTYVLYRGLQPPGNALITIKSLHINLLIHIFGWYADVLWAQLVHSFVQVVGRVLLCGHLIIHTVSIHH